MHEATQITYGEGTVNIIFDSQSTTEVTAPVIRAGDYKQILNCCFTSKELEDIEDGTNAEVTFRFVMSDEHSAPDVYSSFENAISSIESEFGDMDEGIIINVVSEKTIHDETEALDTLSAEFEMQIELPLYLKNTDRDYYVLAENMGSYELMEDVDVDADTLSISTDALGSYLILYQDSIPGETGEDYDYDFHISLHHIFIAAILALIALWFLVDKMHNK